MNKFRAYSKNHKTHKNAYLLRFFVDAFRICLKASRQKRQLEAKINGNSHANDLLIDIMSTNQIAFYY